MRLFRIVLAWLVAPRQLLALAGICAGAGLLWGYATVHENANRKLALRQGPPAAVAIQDYRTVIHRGPAGEVVLHAEADVSGALVLSLPRDGGRALAVPLFPVGGGPEALGAVLLALEEGQDLPDAGRLAQVGADGLVTVTGRSVDPGDFELVLSGALAVEGRSIGDRFIAVQPYMEGREAALQPLTDPPRTWLVPVLASFILTLGAGYGGAWRGAWDSRRRRAAAAAAPAPAASRAMGPKAAAFAPLPRQEEVTAATDPGQGRAVATVSVLLGFAVTVLRAALRGGASLFRLVRTGVADLRSPR